MTESRMYRLHYFPAQGRAQGARYALVAGGIPFEDISNKSNPPSEEDKALWLALGGNTTTNVPLLTDGDKMWSQSRAVLKVAGRKAGLMPANDEDLYLVDKLIADASDLADCSFKAVGMFGATKEAQQKFKNEDIPKHAGNIERQLTGDWFVGGKFSLADVAVYTVLTTNCRNQVPDCLNAFPKLSAFVKRFEAIPAIAAYQKEERFTKLMKFGEIEK